MWGQGVDPVWATPMQFASASKKNYEKGDWLPEGSNNPKEQVNFGVKRWLVFLHYLHDSFI